jgi:hypothetical protein
LLKRAALVRAREREWLRANPLAVAEARRIYEALYVRARALGVFPLRDPLDGIDADVRLARALNVRAASR